MHLYLYELFLKEANFTYRHMCFHKSSNLLYAIEGIGRPLVDRNSYRISYRNVIVKIIAMRSSFFLNPTFTSHSGKF